MLLKLTKERFLNWHQVQLIRFIADFQGQAIVPTRLILNNSSQNGSTLFKPAYVPNEVLGVKVLCDIYCINDEDC